MTAEPNFTNQEDSNQIYYQQSQQITHYNNNSMENEVNILRNQNIQAQQLLAGYEGRVNEMERVMRNYEQRISEFVTCDNIITLYI